MSLIKSFLLDLFAFTRKQASASIFGGWILVMIGLSRLIPLSEYGILSYDFLFVTIMVGWIVMILTGLERREEILVILAFHVLATIMELFKTHPSIGSWNYPSPFHIGIFWVPLFIGFLYSAVGSYIARCWRIFDLQFIRFPRPLTVSLLALAIYLNFFTHHFTIDLRYFLMIIVLVTFGRTQIFFRPRDRVYSMNLAFGFLLVASFIWIAENIGTYYQAWLYPYQTDGWQMVGVEKILSWWLLMIVSFVLVSGLYAPWRSR